MAPVDGGTSGGAKMVSGAVAEEEQEAVNGVREEQVGDAQKNS